jgi:hypothetical protein
MFIEFFDLVAKKTHFQITCNFFCVTELVPACSSLLPPRPDARRALPFSQIVGAAACQKLWFDRIRSANRARTRSTALVRCQKTDWRFEAFVARTAPTPVVDEAGASSAALLLNRGIHELVCIHSELFALVRLSNSIFSPRLDSTQSRLRSICYRHKVVLHTDWRRHANSRRKPLGMEKLVQ